MATKYDKKTQAEALRLYREKGMAEAHRVTGIPKGTLGGWVKRDGVESQATEQTKAATEAKQAENELTREILESKTMQRCSDLLDWMVEKQTDYKGQLATKVIYDRPPAQDQRALAAAFGILWDKLHGGKSEAPPDGSENLKQYKEALRAEAKEVWVDEEAAEEPEEAEPCES